MGVQDTFAMRRLISFLFASALLGTGLYFFVYLLFVSEGFYVWMPAAAATFGFLGASWLWEDFVSPHLGKRG